MGRRADPPAGSRRLGPGTCPAVRFFIPAVTASRLIHGVSAADVVALRNCRASRASIPSTRTSVRTRNARLRVGNAPPRIVATTWVVPRGGESTGCADRVPSRTSRTSSSTSVIIQPTSIIITSIEDPVPKPSAAKVGTHLEREEGIDTSRPTAHNRRDLGARSTRRIEQANATVQYSHVLAGTSLQDLADDAISYPVSGILAFHMPQ